MSITCKAVSACQNIIIPFLFRSEPINTENKKPSSNAEMSVASRIVMYCISRGKFKD